jgi:hypothetical protein
VLQKKMAPIKGAIRLAASIVVLVMMVMVVMMVVVMCLGTRDRADGERNGGNGGQNERKLPHINYSLAGFLSARKMNKASARVKRIFMNACSGSRATF